MFAEPNDFAVSFGGSNQIWPARIRERKSLALNPRTPAKSALAGLERSKPCKSIPFLWGAPVSHGKASARLSEAGRPVPIERSEAASCSLRYPPPQPLVAIHQTATTARPLPSLPQRWSSGEADNPCRGARTEAPNSTADAGLYMPAASGSSVFRATSRRGVLRGSFGPWPNYLPRTRRCELEGALKLPYRLSNGSDPGSFGGPAFFL